MDCAFGPICSTNLFGIVPCSDQMKRVIRCPYEGHCLTLNQCGHCFHVHIESKQFIDDNTEFSTQHGVKGEEYESVLVVIDDVGSAWNNYSFAKTLTPIAAGGEPTDRQRRLTNNLAYVCFSRAEKDLRIVMYSQNAAAAQQELLEKKLFTKAQIEIA